MDSELLSYLQRHRNVANSTQWTHSSQMQPTPGTFVLHNDTLTDFWRLYCDKLWNMKDTFMSGLAERPNKKYMPVLVDVDIKIPYNEDSEYLLQDHIYTPEHVEHIITIYNSLLKSLVPDLLPQHLYCFVLEKSAPYISGTCVKNGFHLHYPFLYLTCSDQEIHLVPRAKQRVDAEQVFKDIPDIQRSSETIDENLTSKNWLLYGSRKSLGLEAYTLSCILDHRLQPVELEDVLAHNKVFDRHDREIDMSQQPLSYYLPMILSVHQHGRPTYKVKDGTECIVKARLHKAEQNNGMFEAMSMPETIALVRKLMEMVNPSRADHHDTWIRMGWCLFNITQGCLEGFTIWVEFSLRAQIRTHVDEARCMLEWGKMKPGSLTLGTLRMWASTDNPQMYNQLNTQQEKQRIQDSLQGGHQDLAKFLYDKYKGQFVCASLKDNLWFAFNGQRWVRSDQGHDLYMKIDTDILPKFAEESKQYSNTAANAEIGPDGQVEVTKAANRQKLVFKTLKNLKSYGFRESVMRCARHMFHDAQFLDKLDANINLLGFDNGVLDLTTCTFRNGEPHDYISKTCQYDYKEYFSQEDAEVDEVVQFWAKVLPDKDVREAFLEYCGKLLRGGNDDQQFLILSGVGANGKTMAMDFISQAFGEYACKFPTTLLTGKETSSSAASPELARSKGCRVGDISEPEGNDTVNVGVIKRLTGMEKIYSRGLFQEGTEFRPQFKLIYICNKLPKLPQDDGGIWRRILLYIFKSRFPANDLEVPLTWKEQCERRIFKRDKDLMNKIPKMRQAMMWLMVQYFKQAMRRRNQQPLPKEVTAAIEMYRAENDHYLQYVGERLKRDAASSITLNDFYNDFKAWYSEQFSSKPPSRHQVRLDMIQKWGDLSFDNRWVGWRFRQMSDDVAEGRIAIVQPNQVNVNE